MTVPPAARSAGPTARTLVDVLRARAADEPETVLYRFLEDGERETAALGYGDLDRRARETAARLQRDLEDGDRVLLVFPPGLEFVVGFFGALYAGAVPVPVYPPQRPEQLAAVERIGRDAAVALVLTTTGFASHLAEDAGGTGRPAPPVVVTETPEADAAEWRDPNLTGDRLAFLQYTSGSTGRPKGVRVGHGNLLWTIEDIDRGFRHGPESVMVTWLPTFHDMGLIYGLLLPLVVGFPSWSMPPLAFLRRPIRWLRAITVHRGTHCAAPNFAYDLCVRKTTEEERAGLDLGSWRVASNGAEPIHEATVRRFAAAFEPHGFRWAAVSPSYGLAEATLKVSTSRVDEPPLVVTLDAAALEEGRVVEAAGDAERTVRPVGCGRSGIGAEILIVGPGSREPCPPDRVGEIWVSSPSVAQGYWNRPEETEATFRAFTAGGRGPFLRTGDLGFVLRSELFVVGRLKDLIIVRGRNYHPHDLEATVEGAGPELRPGCGAVVAVESDAGTRVVVLHEVRTAAEDGAGAGPAPDPEPLLRAIRSALAREHGVSVGDVLLLAPGSIPKTSSGKVRRAASRDLFLRGALDPIAEWHHRSG